MLPLIPEYKNHLFKSDDDLAYDFQQLELIFDAAQKQDQNALRFYMALYNALTDKYYLAQFRSHFNDSLKVFEDENKDEMTVSEDLEDELIHSCGARTTTLVIEHIIDMYFDHNTPLYEAAEYLLSRVLFGDVKHKYKNDLNIAA